MILDFESLEMLLEALRHVIICCNSFFFFFSKLMFWMIWTIYFVVMGVDEKTITIHMYLRQFEALGLIILVKLRPDVKKAMKSVM